MLSSSSTLEQSEPSKCNSRQFRVALTQPANHNSHLVLGLALEACGHLYNTEITLFTPKTEAWPGSAIRRNGTSMAS